MKGHLLGDPSGYWAVLGHGDAVAHDGVTRPDLDLLDECLDEGPALGKLALLQKLAHVLRVGRDGLHVVQDHPPLRQQCPGLLRRALQLFLPLPVVPDAGLEVVDIHVGGFHQVVKPLQTPPHVGQFRLDARQNLPLLTGHSVHLLVHQLDQFPDAALGEYVGPDLLDHQLLEAAGVQPGSVASAAAPFLQGLADVVGELPALGVLPGEGASALVALDQPAEQVGAADAAGMGPLRRAGVHQPVDAAELGLGDDGGKGLLHAHRLGLVLGLRSPDQGASVSLVAQDDVDAVLGPGLAGRVGDALVVQGAGDFQDALARLGHIEYPLDDGRGCRVWFQGGALLGTVLDHQPAVAVGHPAGDPEAAGGRLAHPPCNFLGQIFAIELVQTLDDGLHQLAGGSVVGVLGDGDHPHSLAPEHGLEGDGVLPLAGEAGEFPDKNLLEGGVGPAGLIDHLAELGAVGDSAALGLVHVLAGHHVAVLLGVVPEGPKLGGHGEVHVLAVAGDSGVQGRRGLGVLLVHTDFLLFPVPCAMGTPPVA